MDYNSNGSMPILMLGISMSGCMFFAVAAVVIFIIVKKKKDKDKAEGKDYVQSGANVPSSYTEAGITFYGQGGRGSTKDDNGVGIAGVSLFDYTGSTFNGKPLFPGAVHQKDGAKYLFKVLEVYCDKFKSPGNVVYLHIVDVCGHSADVCNTNVKKYGNFLVDVHYNAFDHVGLDDGLLKGGFKVVGEIRPPKCRNLLGHQTSRAARTTCYAHARTTVAKIVWTGSH